MYPKYFSLKLNMPTNITFDALFNFLLFFDCWKILQNIDEGYYFNLLFNRFYIQAQTHVTKCSAATSYSPLMQLRSGMFKTHTAEVQVFHKNCYQLSPSNSNVININLLYGVLSNIMRLLFPNVFVKYWFKMPNYNNCNNKLLLTVF